MAIRVVAKRIKAIWKKILPLKVLKDSLGFFIELIKV